MELQVQKYPRAEALQALHRLGPVLGEKGQADLGGGEIRGDPLVELLRLSQGQVEGEGEAVARGGGAHVTSLWIRRSSLDSASAICGVIAFLAEKSAYQTNPSNAS